MNSPDFEKRVDSLSDFIDSLNQDKKPAYEINDDEMKQLFETVRAVKRLKTMPNERFEDNEAEKSYPNKTYFKRFIAIASIFLIFALSTVIFQLPFGKSENIVNAMVKAYQKLESYSGIIEIRSLTNEEVDFFETVEVKYKKPNKFLAVHQFDNAETVKISDGDILYTIEKDRVTIDYSKPEKELWRYHIKQQIEEIQEAINIREAGKEAVAGRMATVYEYGVPTDEYSHRVWVDEETNLPLKTELILPENRRLINQFVEIEINPAIAEEVFIFQPEEGQKIIEINSKTNLEKVKEYWELNPSFITDLTGQLEQQDLRLQGVIDLHNDNWYQYVAKFKNDKTGDFVDVYFGDNLETSYIYSQESTVALLGNGWLEADENAVNVFKTYIGKYNTVKWVQNETWQIFFVTNLESGNITELLEEIAGEKINYISYEQLEQLGIKPVITKEGH